MYAHLTKREKQKKLAQARKRVILWSSQEQRKRSLKATASLAKMSTATFPIFYPAETELPPEQIAAKPSPMMTGNTTPIAALQATIDDLKEQRAQLDISIQVLKCHLDALLSTS